MKNLRYIFNSGEYLKFKHKYAPCARMVFAYIAICLYCLLRIFAFYPSIFTFYASIFTLYPSIFAFYPSIFTFYPSIFTSHPSIFTFICFKPSQFLLFDILYVFFVWVIYFQVLGAWWQELQNSHLLISLLYFTTANSLVRLKVERY